MRKKLTKTRNSRPLHRFVVPRTWTMDAPAVRDRVVVAVARAYGYRGTSADTAASVLERHGYQLIPW